MKIIWGITAICAAFFVQTVFGAAPTVVMGTDQLVYTVDDMGNRIPDYSYAGYEGGGVALPTLPNKIVISPLAGGADNTAAIQAAINTVSGLTADAHGFRGAVFLNPGTYPCAGTLSITASGVVLRGAGPTSIIQVTGTCRTFLTAQGSGNTSTSGSAVNITDTYVPCGATTFNVTSTSGFNVGNQVLVSRPFTTTWITAIHMDMTYMGTDAWKASGGLSFERTIKGISGTQVTIDAPLCNPFEAQYTSAVGSPCTMKVFTDNSRMQQSGLENLTISAVFTDVPANVTGSLAANFGNCKNCWMKNVFVSGFGNGLTFGGGSKWCVISHCDFENTPTISSSDPPAAYTLSGQQCLCMESTASNGLRYHLCVTQSAQPGPNVFLNLSASGAGWRDAGPHQRWAAGVLFDHMTMTSSDGSHCYISFENRGTEGSGQGWAMGFSLMWDCASPDILNEEPNYAPYHYNWTVGCTGTLATASAPGENQLFGTTQKPASLYLQQLKERLGTSAVQNLGYARFAGNYKIVAQNSGSAVTVAGASTADGAAVVQLPFVTTASNSKWQFVDVGSGYFEIKNLNSGKALCVQANSTASGAVMVQTTYSAANTSDQWSIVDFPGGNSEIVNRRSGLALDVSGGSSADNTPIDQTTYSGATRQQFRIISVP